MSRNLRHYLTFAVVLGTAAPASIAAAQSADVPQRIVDIEILGTRKENEIKLSEANRSIDVTLLGSVVFKVEDVDKATIRIADVAPSSMNGRKVDYNNDMNPDTQYRIAAGKLKLDESTTTLCLTGALMDGTKFRGCGPIIVKP